MSIGVLCVDACTLKEEKVLMTVKEERFLRYRRKSSVARR